MGRHGLEVSWEAKEEREADRDHSEADKEGEAKRMGIQRNILNNMQTFKVKHCQKLKSPVQK